MVHNWWSGFVVAGCPDYILSAKLKMLKLKLKEWSKNTFCETSSRKNNLLEELADPDKLPDNRDLTEEKIMMRATILVELEVLAKNEEAS